MPGPRWYTANMVRRRWIRLIAIGLLLMAGADLGLPSICRTDSAPLPETQSEQQTFEQDSSEPQAPAPLPVDDCFCCCAHIKPQPIVRGVERLVLLEEHLGLFAPAEPEIRTSSLFHPPRQ